MLKYFLVGVVVFIGVAVAFLPATLVPPALDSLPDVSLTAPAGTLWRGTGELQVRDQEQVQQNFGRLTWDFQPLSLFRLTPTYDVTLQDLTMQISYGFSGAALKVAGEVPLRLFQPWLDPHQISLGGRLKSQSVDVLLDPQQPWTTLYIEGVLDWTGGPVSYFIAQNQTNAILPPLQVRLRSREDVAGEEGAWRLHGDVMGDAEYPLLNVALNESGYVKVSITKRLTNLVGSPWPGSDPDHVTVLEVEQPLF